MLLGAAAAGVRAMTSTSSPGWALMQETMSHLSAAELPCVVVLVQRGGPGMGNTRHAQMDYLSVTRGGGQGGYKTIVLAPATVQETHDLVQLAFYLADKYRNPVVVLSDAVVGQMAEPLEVKTLEFGELPPKDWALRGKGQREDKQRRLVSTMPGMHRLPPYGSYLSYLAHLDRKWEGIKNSEVRHKSYYIEDAELILIAYGYAARVSQEAVYMARAEGLKVGLLRPLTLWPFPYQEIEQRAMRGCRFLVVEDSLGLLVEDVKLSVTKQSEVHLLGALARHAPMDEGLLFPDRVCAEIRKLL
jgi:2-oxoglutarate ferredoxin oxidoreductase subunit alpha